MSSMFKRLVVVLLCLIPFERAVAQYSWKYPPQFNDAEEHVYKTAGDVELRAWLFVPDEPAAAPRPAVVFFFGGGWSGGTPEQFADQCRYLQSRGIVAITCDYRVASRHGVKAVACVEDAKSAIRWVRNHAARLSVNPNQICAAGGSAGGHIACCTGAIAGFDSADEDDSVSSVPDAMVLFNPSLMLAPLDGLPDSGISPEHFAKIKDATGVAPEEISPIHCVQFGQPPTIIFHGTDDGAVPFATVEEFVRRSQAAGNDVTLVPFSEAQHGFFNRRRGTSAQADDSRQFWRSTMEQTDRFLTRLGWIDGEPTERAVSDFVRVRRYLDASRHQFETAKTGRVAFLGGSITEMNGYRVRVEEWLRERFPDTQFDFINAGISSTCSTTGAFRLQRDVLSHGPVDLLFVEFAVNDDQDGRHAADVCARGMEGIVRRALTENPRTDVVLIHFPNDSMLETIAGGEEPVSSRQHEKIARHYDVSSIYLSRHVARAIHNGKLTWDEYGGTHPAPAGHALTATLIRNLLEQGWRLGCPQREPGDLVMPEPLDSSSFFRGRLVAAADADVELSAEWQRGVPAWDELPGSKRERFVSETMLHTDRPDASLRFAFDGTAVGAYVLAGPDAGGVKYRIDEGDWQKLDLFHHYSRGLHYPRTVMFATGLEPGSHRLELVTQPPSADGRGTAARILALGVND